MTIFDRIAALEASSDTESLTLLMSSNLGRISWAAEDALSRIAKGRKAGAEAYRQAMEAGEVQRVA